MRYATKKRIRELTKRNRGSSLMHVVRELRSYLLGWRGYFGFCQTRSVLRDFDSWIHRRLRSYAWKQWKTGQRRFTELRRLGVGKDLAAQTAGSSKRYWHISRSPALNIALPRAHLIGLGLPLLLEPETKV
ncbi:MAG: group II intron maturase-specific domain-containing protein [Pirellulaceae bacterium]